MTAYSLTHLRQLEAESIHIIREVAAEFDNPVMLYSIGKDSAVMVRLAEKAFYPAKPPFPLMHVDTTWKFQEMYQLRDNYIAKELGFKLIVHVNEEGRAQGVNPFTHGSKVHTDIMKTQALRQALDTHRFDAAFGGARRDEAQLCVPVPLRVRAASHDHRVHRRSAGLPQDGDLPRGASVPRARSHLHVHDPHDPGAGVRHLQEGLARRCQGGCGPGEGQEQEGQGPLRLANIFLLDAARCGITQSF